MRKRKNKKLITRVNLLPNVNLPLIEEKVFKQMQASGKITRDVFTTVKKAFTKT